MKKLFITLLLSILYVFSYAQLEKVILTHYNKKPRWVLKCNDETNEHCQLTIYFNDGRVKGKANVMYHNQRDRFRPNGDAIVYFENGLVFQEYNHASGILLTYYPTGELKEKMITPIKGELEQKIKYYKDGQIWEEEEAKREVDRQNLIFAHSNSHRNKDFFYDNHGYSYNYLKTYHSNGVLKSHSYIDRDAPHLKYIYKFYKPDGTLDINATYDRERGRGKKQGRRYSYHPNGKLREIADYVNNEFDGELKRWASSGQLLQHWNMKRGSRFGKCQDWWENGQPKEISYYASSYKNGPVLRWNRDGKIMEQGTYYLGNAIGVATMWDTLGNRYYESFGSNEVRYMNASYYNPRQIYDQTIWLEGEGQFKNGLRDGEWRFYYKAKGKNKERIDGLCAIQNYKSGVLHGAVKIYYPNGNILLETNLRNGWLDGGYFSGREEGFTAATGTFAKHKKDEIWTTYHYNSNQKYSIQLYEDNVYIETLKEWDADGFLTKDRIDKPSEQHIERYDYRKSGSYAKFIQPYGWKYMHSFYFNEKGQPTESRIIQNDDPKHYTWTKYYPNGNKKFTASYLNSKPIGLAYRWYENGMLKSETPHQNGKRHGKATTWDEYGIATHSYFRNGIQVIVETEDEMALECSCNHPPKEMKTTFMSWFLDYVPYEKAKQRTKYLFIPEMSYKRLFNKSGQQYGSNFYGDLTVVNDFYIEVENGIRLNFTPCRRGSNRTHLNVRGDYYESVNKVDATISDFDLSVEFPENILRLYNFQTRQPVKTSIEKYKRSNVRFEVKHLNYQDNGKDVTIRMSQSGSATPCYQISEIGQTGFLLAGSNAHIDLSSNSFNSQLNWNLKSSHKLGYQTRDHKNILMPSNKYLNKFMGIFFEDGQLYIPYNGTLTPVNIKDVLVGGKEIYGNAIIEENGDILFSDLKDMPYFFANYGFDVLDYQFEDDKLYLFWRYVGQ